MTNGWTGGQFSVVRTVVALYLLAALGSQALTLPELEWALIAGVGALLCVPLALGEHRLPGVGLCFIVLGVGGHLALSAPTPRLSAAVLIGIGAQALLVISMLPLAPYGSWPARGRADPDDGWRFPPRLFAALWAIVAVMYLVWSVLLLPDVGWRAATHGMRLGAFGHEAPAAVSIAGNWYLLAAWLAFAPLALWRRTRPIGWGAALAANVVVLPLAGHGAVAAPLVVLHGLTFDPAWLPARTAGTAGPRDVLFYDGHCGLCHRAVRFVLAEDVEGRCFELAPLQGDYFEAMVPAAERAALPASVVLRQADGTLRVKSNAVIAMLDRLGGLWRVAAWGLCVVPRVVRDGMYDAVAAVRLRLFAQPSAVCPVVPGHLRERFRM